MLFKLSRCHNGGLQRKDFVLGCVVVPLAHDLFGLGVVQGGEGLVGELANQVFVAVDFKGVECGH